MSVNDLKSKTGSLADVSTSRIARFLEDSKEYPYSYFRIGQKSTDVILGLPKEITGFRIHSTCDGCFVLFDNLENFLSYLHWISKP